MIRKVGGWVVAKEEFEAIPLQIELEQAKGFSLWHTVQSSWDLHEVD